MTTPAEPDASASEDAVVLYCPHCEYNLTGLPEDRCPECGRVFDRAKLADDTRVRRLLPRAMQDGPGGFRGWSAYRSIVHQSLFQPARLARSVPRIFHQDDPLDLSVYSRIYATLILVALLVVGIILVIGLDGPVEGAMVLPMLVPAAHVWFTSFLTELLVVLLLNTIAPQTRPGQGRTPQASSSWFGLVAMHSGFQLVMCTALGVIFLCLLVAVAIDAAEFAVALLSKGLVACFGIFPLWWYVSLSISVYVWSRSKGRAVAAIVIIPIGLFAMGYLLVLFWAS